MLPHLLFSSQYTLVKFLTLLSQWGFLSSTPLNLFWEGYPLIATASKHLSVFIVLDHSEAFITAFFLKHCLLLASVTHLILWSFSSLCFWPKINDGIYLGALFFPLYVVFLGCCLPSDSTFVSPALASPLSPRLDYSAAHSMSLFKCLKISMFRRELLIPD